MKQTRKFLQELSLLLERYDAEINVFAYDQDPDFELGVKNDPFVQLPATLNNQTVAQYATEAFHSDELNGPASQGCCDED